MPTLLLCFAFFPSVTLEGVRSFEVFVPGSIPLQDPTCHLLAVTFQSRSSVPPLEISLYPSIQGGSNPKEPRPLESGPTGRTSRLDFQPVIMRDPKMYEGKCKADIMKGGATCFHPFSSPSCFLSLSPSHISNGSRARNSLKLFY